jgi:pimeloyl-ACP methyl ester carboxylesterase
VLDALADRADTANTYAIALSFSGHLALRCAARDQRMRGIVTAGVPVRAFFTHDIWRAQLPAITVDTLGHLTGTEPAKVGEHLRDWALTDDELAEVNIPVRAIVSQHDEIIPAADVHLLRARLRDFGSVSYPDVHGAPAHVVESRLWTVRSVLGMRGGMTAQRAVLRALLTIARTRRALARAGR